jgi:hypothetical protein
MKQVLFLPAKHAAFCKSDNEYKDEKRDELMTLGETNYIRTPKKPYVLEPWMEALARKSVEIEKGSLSKIFLN